MQLPLSASQFIHVHRTDDVRKLALSGSLPADVDRSFVLDQIQGWQTARHKIPTWAAIDGMIYPPHLNMEQCSSEPTARYKAHVLREALGYSPGEAQLIDLTGGFGVDFSFMSETFGRAVYVERQTHLCDIVRHNLGLLGRTQAEVVCGDGTEYLRALPAADRLPVPTVIYLDPARRDSHGHKVALLSQCEPDVTLLRDTLLARAAVVMIKLSPMLDWHVAVAVLSEEGRGCEVHIVSVANECKELLLVLTHHDRPMRLVCVNDEERYEVGTMDDPAHLAARHEGDGQGEPAVLLVPNSSVMKAGCFDALATHFGLHPLDPNSHLFTAPQVVEGFPGRQFALLSMTTMNKKELRRALQGIDRANIAVRNFPLSADDLRRRLKLRDGGDHYIFGTTCAGLHQLLICRRF